MINYLLKFIYFTAAYWLLWHFSELFEIAYSTSAFYPASSLIVIGVLFYGVRITPVLFVAVVIGAMPESQPWEMELNSWLMGVHQLVVYGALGLGLRHLNLNFPLFSRRDATLFIVTAICASFISSVTAVYIFKSFDIFPNEILGDIFWSFWAGDSSGILMATPIIIAVFAVQSSRLTSKGVHIWNLMQFLEILILPLLFSIAVFGSAMFDFQADKYAYFIILPVILVAARHGAVAGCTSAVVANVTSAIVFILVNDNNVEAIELQVLFAGTSALGLYVGTIFEEKISEELTH